MLASNEAPSSKEIFMEARIAWRQQCKTSMIIYCISIVVVCVFSGLVIQSSSNLSSTYSYYPGVQIVAIISAVIAAIDFFFSIFIFMSEKNLQKLSPFILVVGVLTIGLAISMCFVSVIISVISVQCGYYIGHDGQADGLYITSYMQVSSTMPTCSQMEQSSIPMKTLLTVQSIAIIENYCDMYTSQRYIDCMSTNTLVVEQWSTMFNAQVAGGIIGLIGMIFVLVTISRLIQKMKRCIMDVRNRKQALISNNYNPNVGFQAQVQAPVVSQNNIAYGNGYYVQGQPAYQQPQQQQYYGSPQQNQQQQQQQNQQNISYI